MSDKQMDRQEEGKRSDSNKGEKQPHRMRLPGFLIQEEIGLGDVIKRATYTVGIRPTSGCGCEGRARALNRWMVLSPRGSR